MSCEVKLSPGFINRMDSVALALQSVHSPSTIIKVKLNTAKPAHSPSL